nr:LOW QUALITY PROTEIN: carcinoembryonic antigen-related cell adhesion molecule 3-like [Gorilla gorilla gorilla]
MTSSKSSLEIENLRPHQKNPNLYLIKIFSSLLSGPTRSSRFLYAFLTQPWNQLFLQGALVPFMGERCLQAIGTDRPTVRRGRIPWQGFLLTASVLTFWNPPTTAMITVEAMLSNAAKGKEVLLLTHNLPHDLIGYNWYKGERVEANHHITGYVIGTLITTPGPAHSIQGTIYPNASLLIQNVTQDTGFYTLHAIKINPEKKEVSGQFHVYEKNAPGLPAGAVAGIVTRVLVRVAPVATLACFLLLVRTGRPWSLKQLHLPDIPSLSCPGPATRPQDSRSHL